MHHSTEVILDSPSPSSSNLLGALRLDVMGLVADEDSAAPFMHAEAPAHSSGLRQDSLSHYLPTDEDSMSAAQQQHALPSRHDSATSHRHTQAEQQDSEAGTQSAPAIRGSFAQSVGANEGSWQQLDPAHNRHSSVAEPRGDAAAAPVPPALSAEERRAGVASSSAGSVGRAPGRGRAQQSQAAQQQQQSEVRRRAMAHEPQGHRVGRQTRPAQAAEHRPRSATAQQAAAADPRLAYPIQRVPPAFYQQQPTAPPGWDYPYLRRPVASPCDPADIAGLKLEALFQNVLRYPRALPRLCRFLRHQPGGIAPRLPAITGTVQKLNDLVGREVALYMLRRVPWLVLVPSNELLPRIENVRSMLGVRGPELLMTIRKNPQLLRLDRLLVRQRYDMLHDTTGFTQEQVRALVIKYPLVLNFQEASVARALQALRQLSSTRPMWVHNFEILSPSQLAFFLRDRQQQQQCSGGGPAQGQGQGMPPFLPSSPTDELAAVSPPRGTTSSLRRTGPKARLMRMPREGS